MIDLYPNETLVIQWLLFMVALIILNWGVFRPILKLIRERHLRTEGDEAQAQEFGKKIMELSSKVDESLQRARQEGQEIILGLRQEAESTSAKTTELARQRMESQLADVRRALEKESVEAELQLKQHAKDLANELGKQVLERPLT